MRSTCVAGILAIVSLGSAGVVHARAVREQPSSQIGHYRSAAIAQASGHEVARGGGPGDFAAPSPYVHERFARDLADGCEYRADVRGAIRPAVSDARAVRADLVVRADLHCPNVSSVRAPARRVSVRTASPDQLAARVADGGVVRAGHEGRRCAYEPAFAFRDGVLVNTDVAVNCGGDRR